MPDYTLRPLNSLLLLPFRKERSKDGEWRGRGSRAQKPRSLDAQPRHSFVSFALSSHQALTATTHTFNQPFLTFPPVCTGGCRSSGARSHLIRVLVHVSHLLTAHCVNMNKYGSTYLQLGLDWIGLDWMHTQMLASQPASHDQATG